MPSIQGSVECCNKFKHIFKEKTKLEYSKSEKNIYKLLCEYGNEKEAIKIARIKLAGQEIKDKSEGDAK